MDWIIANGKDLMLLGTGAVTLASIVVKLTPNKVDDAILEKVLKVLNLIALNPKK